MIHKNMAYNDESIIIQFYSFFYAIELKWYR